MTVVIALALLVATQDVVVDRATLVIREGGREVGRETYTIQQRRLNDGTSGYSLEARGSYARLRTSLRMSLSSRWEPRQIEQTTTNFVGGDRTLVTGQAGRGRFRLRTVGPDHESEREHPARDPVLLLSDSVFSGYVLVGYSVIAGQNRFTSIDLSTGERATLNAVDRGMQSTIVSGVSMSLRDIEVSAGDVRFHVWIRPDGSLVKIDLPDHGVVVERLAAS